MPLHWSSERVPVAGKSLAAISPAGIVPSGLFAAFLAKLPNDVRASLTDTQLSCISKALSATKGQHLIEYRASLPFFGHRYYLTVFFGPERRSLSRLVEEGQTDIHVITYAYVVILFLLVGGMTLSLVFLFYLAKSALGIDLFDGPSSLHDLLFSQS